MGLITFASCSKHSGGPGTGNTSNTPTDNDSMPKGGYKLGWQAGLGGAQNDNANSVIRTADGGYLTVGSTNSNNTGDVGPTYGGYDIWVVKFNAHGDKVWTQILGGTKDDYGLCAVAASDGGYVVGGTVTNTDNSPGLGNVDGYIAKLSSSGQVLWTKELGTTEYDYINALVATSDGGYAFAGRSDGYLTGRGYDMWLGKLDGNGNYLWHKSLGGTKDDIAFGLTVTQDGGLALAGFSKSSDGDLLGSPNYGQADMCVIKTNGSGNIVWAKNLGGSGYDAAYSIAATADGGVVAGGYTNSSNSGLVGTTNGGYDAWLVKLKPSGDTAWTRALGGSYDELCYSLITTSYGGYALAASTSSNNSGDVGPTHGLNDIWVVELDGDRNIIYQRAFGGSSNEPYYSFPSIIRQQGGGGFVVAADSYGKDGDLEGVLDPGKDLGNLWMFQLH
jgi:hypothetical protein